VLANLDKAFRQHLEAVQPDNLHGKRKGDVQFAKPGQYSGDRMGTRSVIRVKRASDDPVNVLIGPFTLSPFAP
jgi:hypothetical protein